MRVLVTGGAGFVGSALVPMLLEHGHSVHVVDNLMYDQDSLLACVAYPGFHFTAADVRNPTVLKDALSDADLIVHLAALVGMPACEQNPRLARELNTDATRLLNELRSPDQPLLYASTGSVYGAVSEICTEETPPAPLSVYGRTKYAGELAAKSKPNWLAFRFATAFGVAPRFRMDLLPNSFVYGAVRDRHLLVYERHARRTLIHVRDIARSWLHAIDHFDSMREQVFNVGDESMNVTKDQILQAIADNVEFAAEYAEFAADPDKRDYEVSYSRIRSTGFETTITLAEGIRELVVACSMLTVRNRYTNVLTHAVGPSEDFA